MKRSAAMIEGPKAFENFRMAMKQALSVSHEEIQRRIEQERKKSALNPNRRGPKGKSAKTSASSRASKPAGKP
jgi:hypothetical protein